MIQRRGRTGRHRIGRVVILMTRGTRDEAYYWSSRNKEKSMRKELRGLKEELAKHLVVDEAEGIAKELRTAGWESVEEGPKEEKQEDIFADFAEFADDGTGEMTFNGDGKEVQITQDSSNGEEEWSKGPSNNSSGVGGTSTTTPGKNPTSNGSQMRLGDFKAALINKLEGEKEKEEPEKNEKEEPQLKVIVDSREFKSKVVVELSNHGLVVEQQQLEVGDYVVSDRCGIERKEVEDFLQSLIDKRLFSQIKRLVQAYPRPLVILEGEGLYTKRRISPEAIMGALSSIAISFKVPIVTTKDAKETADLIAVIAKKEYQAGTPLGTRGQKGYMSTKERQEFLVEGLPNVSVTIAKRLLAHFGSVEGIMNADVKQLCEVKGVGKQTAQEIKDVLQAHYAGKKED